MSDLQILLTLNSIGYWAYASVLVYCSISNPPKDALTRMMRVITGMLALLLGTNTLRNPDDKQSIVFISAHAIFQFAVAFSAFEALRKKYPHE